MKSEYAQRLMFNGIVVFTLGLSTGFFLYGGALANPQIGAITHLEGVLNGIFLVVLGLIWHRMVLGKGLEKALMVLATACVYINYFQALWGAYFGRSRPTTLFPQDRVPFPFEKLTLDIVLAGMSIGFMIVCAMTLYGLYRGIAAQRAAAATARPAAV